MFLLHCIILASLLAKKAVVAFPSGAGSCNAGTNAILLPGFPHAEHSQVGGTALSSFGLEVSLNGETLDPSIPFSYTAGESYSVSINATQQDFRGFLIRIADTADFVDTTLALAPLPNDTDVRVALETCIFVNLVGGITHTSNEDKSFVTGILKLDEPADELHMDVTVVVRNSIELNVSEWYFSNYTLSAASTAEAPSAMPSAAPDVVTQSPTSPLTEPPSSASVPGLVLSASAGIAFAIFNLV